MFVTKLKMLSPSYIKLNRTHINFGAVIGESKTGSQNFLISNSGGGTLNWSVSDNVSWLNCSPSSGSNDGSVTVSVDVTGLSAGTYTGEITVTDPNATNSPQTVSVTLNVYAQGASSEPFGEFATPIDGSTVSSSIAVTGWILDDIGVKSVKIYRGNTGSLVFIGDAVFVEGARPDVEQAYPGYPMNYKAGWGYMMLTNFLPNGGNGTFKIHAIATDIEGNEITVGTKTIYCDNANAVKPFGAIDTPTQGGTASGSHFINWGWVLTPQPNKIPTDGSTIKVWVDSVNIGNPTYNVYRVDIATLFPGYNNSNGAVGHFSLDTTAYTNGVHTISWTATDSGGNTDGIGSRYFAVQNTGEARTSSPAGAASGIQKISSIRIESFEDFPIDYSTPVRIRKRFVKDIEPEEIYPDNEGLIKIEIKELGRLVIQLSESNFEMDLESSSSDHLTLNTQHPTPKNTPPNRFNGYLQVGSSLKSLPIGSTLDSARGVFYWQPGPGFIGKYRFVFIEKGQDMDICRKNIIVRILPMFK